MRTCVFCHLLYAVISVTCTLSDGVIIMEVAEGTSVTMTYNSTESLSGYSTIKFLRNFQDEVVIQPKECQATHTTELYKIQCEGRTVKLTILNVTRGLHNSIWSCGGITGRSTIYLGLVRLKVIFPPRAIEIINTTTTRGNSEILWTYPGNRITLECVSRDGYPEQAVRWYKGSVDSTILESTATVTEVDGAFTVWSRLTLVLPLADNGTTYVCQSSQGGKEVSQKAVELHFIVPARGLDISNTDKNGNGDAIIWGHIGRALTLECISSNSYPQPTLLWYKDTLEENPLPTDVSVKEIHGLLTITSRFTFTPTLDNNRTQYICQSSHSVTDVKVVTNTSVWLYLVVLPQTPEISSPCSMADHQTWEHMFVLARPGHELMLECISKNGYPQQTVEWYRDDGSNVTSVALQAHDYYVNEEAGQFTVLSRYTFTPTQNDSGTIFTCQSITVAMGLNTLQTQIEIKMATHPPDSADTSMAAVSTPHKSSVNLIVGLTCGAGIAVCVVIIAVILLTARRQGPVRRLVKVMLGLKEVEADIPTPEVSDTEDEHQAQDQDAIYDDIVGVPGRDGMVTANDGATGHGQQVSAISDTSVKQEADYNLPWDVKKKNQAPQEAIYSLAVNDDNINTMSQDQANQDSKYQVAYAVDNEAVHINNDTTNNQTEHSRLANVKPKNRLSIPEAIYSNENENGKEDGMSEGVYSLAKPCIETGCEQASVYSLAKPCIETGCEQASVYSLPKPCIETDDAEAAGLSETVHGQSKPWSNVENEAVYNL